MALTEYDPGSTFPGTAGRTTDESSPAWPRPTRAVPGAPNVLTVVLDDTGFGQLGCYGSPIETPTFDALAADGLRYNNMHTTALCSPSRSCILTGRNHHSNGMACITEFATGFPGYDGVIPFENGMLSEMLLGHGYNTFMVGKWHLTPSHQETAAGPYDRWPLARGFERFYGFLGGDTSQWYPDLVYDNHQVEPPATPEEGYHLTEDLVDRSIEFIADSKQIDPDKPFYLHLCFGATHAPHHAPKEWADKYAGRFDDGWEVYRERVFAKQKELGIVPADAVLSRHDPDVPEWDAQPAEARRLYSRMMEVFAGFLSHTDHHLGRLMEFLREEGMLDNTIVMVISDNGASAEGGPTGTTNEAQFFNNAQEPLEDSLALIDEIGGPKHFNHYPWGWTWAGNTPFRRWKRETYRGGSSDPFIVSWPQGIRARGEVRPQYAHIIDMVPTLLDLLDIEPPATIRGVTQSPIQGISFAHTLDDAEAATNHHTQYFEMLGHRSIYHDGWRAVCPWPGPSFAEAGVGFGQPISADRLSELDATAWELYHVEKDFAETHDLAGEHRDKLIALIGLWYAEAGKYDVLPVDGSGLGRLMAEKPLAAVPRDRYVYRPGTQSVPFNAAPRVLSRPHSITAKVEIPDEGAEGVLLCQGSAAGGYSLYVQDGRLHYVHNYVGRSLHKVSSPDPVPPGPHELRFEFEPTGQPDLARGLGAPGRIQLYVDGTLVADAEASTTTPFMLNPGALTCGANPGSPVTPDTPSPFRFTGILHSVTVDVSGELITDPEGEPTSGDGPAVGQSPGAQRGRLTTPRSAGLAGVVFAATFSASMILLRTSMPEDPLTQPEWSDAAATRLKIALALVPIAGIAFLWFVGVVRDRLGDLEDRFFSSVYFGSGLLFLAMVFVSMALAGAIVATADWDASRSSRPEIVAFGRAVMLQVTNVYALRMAAVFMISLGTTWHRSGTAPRWLVITTYVIALCLLVITSLSLWVALVFPGWVLLVSVYVLVTVRRAGSRLL